MGVEIVSLRRPDAVVEEAEEVPFGGSFGLEVPEDPALDLVLCDVDLGSDVIGGGSLQVLVPLVDGFLGGARANIGGGFVGAIGFCLGVGAVVASTDAIAVLLRVSMEII
jgi:hypothetical protein